MEEKIAERTGNFSTFHPFMDFVTAIWSNDLDTLIDDLQTDEMDFLALSWTSDYDSQTYYSVIFKPCGYVHLELVGNTTSSDNAQLFTAHDRPRVFFNDRSNMPNDTTGSEYNTPLTVSRATARMDEIKAFYTSEINVTVIHSEIFEDGSEVLVVAFAWPTNIVQMVFWAGRVVENPIEDEELWTVEMWETYVRGVHDDIFVDSFCGNDQWFDNHYAYDSDIPLVDFADHAERLGLKYHWWYASFSDKIQVYVSDPTGWSVQFDGNAVNAPAFIPFYGVDCMSNDGCEGQGTCDSMLDQFIQYLLDN